MRACYLTFKSVGYTYKGSLHAIQSISDALGRIEIYGYENVPKEPCIVVANHVSFLDPVAVGLFFETPLCAVARDSLMEKWPFSAYFRALNAIAIKRGSSGNLGAFRDVLDRVKKGQGVIIFPEGTRSPDGNLLPGKPGAGLLAIKAGIPILPLRSFGFERVLPRTNRLRGGTRLMICAGKPLEPSEIDPGKGHPDRAQVIVDKVMEAISKITPPRLREI